MRKSVLSRTVITCFVAFLAIVGGSLQAQTLKLNANAFSMTIFGTTNIHDFQSKVTQASGELVIKDAKPQSMLVEIPVKGIKSKEKLMDTKTYKAFNADKYPVIIFQLTNVSELQVAGNEINVMVAGNLTMNGVTKPVILKSSGKIVKPGVYEFSGSLALKMTDFKMQPPTAMLGLMKVRDPVTVKYTVTFEGQPVN